MYFFITKLYFFICLLIDSFMFMSFCVLDKWRQNGKKKGRNCRRTTEIATGHFYSDTKP